MLGYDYEDDVQSMLSWISMLGWMSGTRISIHSSIALVGVAISWFSSSSCMYRIIIMREEVKCITFVISPLHLYCHIHCDGGDNTCHLLDREGSDQTAGRQHRHWSRCHIQAEGHPSGGKVYAASVISAITVHTSLQQDLMRHGWGMTTILLLPGDTSDPRVLSMEYCQATPVVSCCWNGMIWDICM